MENSAPEEVLPDLEEGEEIEIDGTLYYRPVPYEVHEHDFVEVGEGEYQCKYCPQGRIGHLN